MRILHVTHQYAPAVGGAEQYIQTLSEELASRGHQVDVYTSRSRDYMTWRNELPPRAQINGVEVYRFRAIQRRGYTWRLLDMGMRNYRAVLPALWEPMIFFGNGPVMPGLGRAIRRNGGRYDVVHISNIHYAHAWPAFRAARRQGLPVVVTPHLHAEQPATYDVGYMRSTLSGAQAVLAVTPAERDFMRKERLAQRVVVGGNSLVMDDFPPLDQAEARRRLGVPRDAFVILFLGRKVAYKGLERTLTAFDALRRQGHDVHFLAYGAETDESRRLWADYEAQQGAPLDALPGLDVRDAVSDEERLAALAACDVFVMPSTGEAFGIVYLEAWAYGKPVIGANISAVSSLIDDGVNGYLVDPARPGQVVNRLAGLAADSEKARAMGDAGREKLLRRYTSQRIGDIVEGLYRRVIRHAGSG
jgi:glycosyltransferase involved in cell wall biosynthesis